VTNYQPGVGVFRPTLELLAAELYAALQQSSDIRRLKGEVRQGSWDSPGSVAGYVSCIPTGSPSDEAIEAILNVEQTGSELQFRAEILSSSGRVLRHILLATLDDSWTSAMMQAHVLSLGRSAVAEMTTTYVHELLEA